MLYPLRTLEVDDDGNPLEWERLAIHTGCPEIENLEFPTAATLCVSGQSSTEDYRTQILTANFIEGADYEEPTYQHLTWDWYNYPDPRLLDMRVPDVVNLTNILPAIRKTFITELKSLADALRAMYNLPRWSGEIPPEWVSGEALSGGTLVRQGYSYYWSRVDLTAEQNTRSPRTEERAGSLVRFRLFNQGQPDLPASNVTLARGIVLNQTDMEADRVFKYQGEIVPLVDLKFFDFVPPDNFPLASLGQGDRFSVSNANYRLIARVVQVSDFLVVIDDTVYPVETLSGTRLVWDPEWDGGDWIEGETVQMRFLVSKRRR